MKRILVLLLLFTKLIAQDKSYTNLSLQNCIDIALKRNLNLEIARLEAEQGKRLINTTMELPKTNFLFTQGQFNSIYKFDNALTVSQTIPFPGTNLANKKIATLNYQRGVIKMELTERDIVYHVKTSFHSLSHHLRVKNLLILEDSVYGRFLAVEKEKYSQGKSSLLEYTVVNNKKIEIENSLIENEEMILDSKTELKKLLNIEDELSVKEGDYYDEIQDIIDSSFIDVHPLYKFYQMQKSINELEIKYNKKQMLPEIVLGYTNISIYGPANIGQGDYFLQQNNRLSSFTVGLNIPLWLRPYRQKTKYYFIKRKVEDTQLELTKLELDLNWKRSLQTYQFYVNSIIKSDGQSSSNYVNIISEALASFSKSEINYIDYLTVVSTAINTEQHHLFAQYHKVLAKIQIDYLIGK